MPKASTRVQTGDVIANLLQYLLLTNNTSFFHSSTDNSIEYLSLDTKTRKYFLTDNSWKLLSIIDPLILNFVLFCWLTNKTLNAIIDACKNYKGTPEDSVDVNKNKDLKNIILDRNIRFKNNKVIKINNVSDVKSGTPGTSEAPAQPMDETTKNNIFTSIINKLKNIFNDDNISYIKITDVYKPKVDIKWDNVLV